MENSISIRDIKKVYHIYDSPKDRLKELLSPTKKKYYREFHALDGVSFDVGRGEAFGIIGVNGSGKSTLLQIICGILKPTSGTVETTGRIAALLELGTGFNPEFTGRENVYLNGALMGLTKEEIDGRYKEIADFADIGDFMDQPVKIYSSGMYVRLGFACAINVDPDILVVDEALSVGDVFFQQKCFRKMNEMKESGMTMLLVSHGMEAVQRNCGRAALLDGGNLVRVGESRDVVNHYLETILMKGRTATGRPAGEKPLKADAGKAPPGVEDRCRLKPYYNKNEFRYGNFKASIVDFGMAGADGREKAVVMSGERLTFKFEVLFHEVVDFPIYGLMIKTKQGVTLYGTNSMYEEAPVEKKGKGDRVTVEFTQDINLLSGDYFVSVGVAEQVGGEARPVDRRYDLAHFGVMPAGKSFGLVNLFSKIAVRDSVISKDA